MNILWKWAHALINRDGGVLQKIGRFLDILEHILFANSISAKASIGAGTYFYHRGLGCVVHPKCIIGEKCTIFQHVTLGSKWSGWCTCNWKSCDDRSWCMCIRQCDNR